MADTATQEREAVELRQKINELKASGAQKRVAAEKLRDDEKAKGFNLADTSDEAKATFERIDAAYKEADTDLESASELERRLHAMLDHVGASAIDRSGGDPRHPAITRARSMGAIVVDSAQYKHLVDSGQLTQAHGKVSFDPVQVLNKEQTRLLLGGNPPAIFADAGDGTPLVPSDERLIPPVDIPKRMPTVLDLINVSSTGRDAVTWTRQTARTTQASTTVAYGTPLGKSRYQYETVTSPVYRKGHYAVVDEGNIADQDEFRGIVDGELLSDLRIIVEDDVLNAAGGSDWTGIYQTGSIGSFDAATADNLADALHKAITTVRVALEREPTAYGLSPEDFEDFYLEKGTDGHYLHHRGPIEGQVKSVWGLPAVVSTAFAAPLVGDWARGATLWVREGVSIAVDRIDDQFLEGLWSIRAQMRGAFAVKQPLAFCEVTNFES